MSCFTIKKGLDLPIAGAPRPDVTVLPYHGPVAVYQETKGLKAKLMVAEGDAVQRGSPLFFDKQRPEWHACAPVAGTVRTIEFGPRRALYRIIIEPSGNSTAVAFDAYTPDQLRTLNRDQILNPLLRSGLLSLIRQRPFSRMADPAITPKAIFVNGMHTAPFTPELDVVVRGEETAFQAGLNLLTRLTEGNVHLCLPPPTPETSRALQEAQHATLHFFEGPHPAGNTSVHIHHIDPLLPSDHVWTVNGVDLIRIGQFFLTGEYPASKWITLAGPGVQEDARRYYRVPVGMPLDALLHDRLVDGEQRILQGDVLAGQQVDAQEHLRFAGTAITVLPEGRAQFFMGWLAPGVNKFSVARAYWSGWFEQQRKWKLTTSLNGSYRAMVLTGWYDRYMPLNIMVDYLVRAVLAQDTEEAIQLGILETDPEDFALCSFVCPSKMDVCGIIQQGLEAIEKEGI